MYMHYLILQRNLVYRGFLEYEVVNACFLVFMKHAPPPITPYQLQRTQTMLSPTYFSY